jgi:hypothetical protein
MYFLHILSAMPSVGGGGGFISKDIVYIDYWPRPPCSLAWLVADINSCEVGLARLIGGRFKEDSS